MMVAKWNSPISSAEITIFFEGKTIIIKQLKTKLSGKPQSNHNDILGDLLIEMSSQKILPVVSRLMEKKILFFK